MKALTALTMGKKPAPSSVSRLTPLPAPDPQSDILFEMFQGSLGSVHLGRLLKGHDAGRLVTLRKLRGPASVDLAAAADLARSIAHPKFVKVLGVVEERGSTYLVSENISGVTLFELGRAATNRQLPVQVSVAVRIILDALTAAAEAQQLLAETLSAHAIRCVYPECVWVADFGETMVSEVMVAPLLAATGRVPEAPLSESQALAADVRVAALELVRMACAGLSPEDPLNTDLSSLPGDLQDVLIRALASSDGYASPTDFIEALSGLDESLIASEDQVGQELKRLMGNVLTVRRQKLAMLERSSLLTHPEEQSDETKFFRVASKADKTEERATARPPSDELNPASVPTPIAPAPSDTDTYTPTPAVVGPSTSVMKRSEPPEEPTRLFKRQKSGSPVDALALEEGEATQVSRARASAASLLAPAPRARRGSWVLVAVALVVALAGVRLTWLSHRYHASPASVWHSDVQAVQRLVAKLHR
ncbi:MAG: hypothetical protein ABW061_02555 [Polyangiaceae bacterium]